MKTPRLILAASLAAGLCLAAGCRATQGKDERASPSAISCPYTASPERAKQIRDGAKKVVKGMPVEAVEKILGKPDEKLHVYGDLEEMKQKSGSSGYAYVYLLQRKQKDGGLLERGEKLLKVNFNNQNLVVNVEKVGLN